MLDGHVLSHLDNTLFLLFKHFHATRIIFTKIQRLGVLLGTCITQHSRGVVLVRKCFHGVEDLVHIECIHDGDECVEFGVMKEGLLGIRSNLQLFFIFVFRMIMSFVAANIIVVLGFHAVHIHDKGLCHRKRFTDTSRFNDEIVVAPFLTETFDRFEQIPTKSAADASLEIIKV